MLSRFSRYIDKVFHFSDHLSMLTDSRIKPQIPCDSVWLSAFFMHAMGYGSLNAAEQDLRVPGRLDGLIGTRKPSADTIGEVFSQMHSEPLRKMLSSINHRIARNKILENNYPLRFAAVDGHELFSLTNSLLSAVS